MTRTSGKFGNAIQKSRFCTVLVVAGLVAVATTVETAARTQKAKHFWSKRAMSTYCLNQREILRCARNSNICLCGENRVTYLWTFHDRDHGPDSGGESDNRGSNDGGGDSGPSGNGSIGDGGGFGGPAGHGGSIGDGGGFGGPAGGNQGPY